MPIFPRVAALLGNEFRGMAAIQASTFAGVPHVQPGELDRVANGNSEVVPGVPYGHDRTPRR